MIARCCTLYCREVPLIRKRRAKAQNPPKASAAIKSQRVRSNQARRGCVSESSQKREAAPLLEKYAAVLFFTLQPCPSQQVESQTNRKSVVGKHPG